MDDKDFTNGFDSLVALHEDFVKKATEANKKVAVEILNSTKTVFEQVARNIDSFAKTISNS